MQYQIKYFGTIFTYNIVILQPVNQIEDEQDGKICRIYERTQENNQPVSTM